MKLLVCILSNVRIMKINYNTRFLFPCAVIFLFSLFHVYTASAQMPINSFKYSKSGLYKKNLMEQRESTKFATEATKSADSIKKVRESQIASNLSKQADTFFISENGKDIAIRLDTLRQYMNRWNDTIKNARQSIFPYFGFTEKLYIDTLRNRIIRYRQQKIDSIELHFTALSSSRNAPEIIRLDSIIKSLSQLSKSYYAINGIYGNPQFKTLFFPAKNTIRTAMLYQKYGSNFLQVGTNIAFYGWENRGTINPELVSFIAGPFRFALNTLVSSSANGDSVTAQDENVKLRTLSGNGGNLAFNVYWPIFHFSNNSVTTFLQASPKFVIEAPVLGSPFGKDSTFGNVNLGIDLNFSVKLPISGGPSLYAYVRPAYVIGSGKYLHALGINENFFLMQETIGIDIPGLGRLGFSIPPLTNVQKLRSDNFLLSFMVTPQNILN